VRRLNQREVDEIRTRALTQQIITAVKQRNARPDVQHVRFHKGKITAPSMGKGNPPSDTDRHPWERGLNLVVHCEYIPPSTTVAVLRILHEAKLAKKDGARTGHGWNLDNISGHVADLQRDPQTKLNVQRRATEATAVEKMQLEKLAAMQQRSKMKESLEAKSKQIVGVRKMHDKIKPKVIIDSGD